MNQVQDYNMSPDNTSMSLLGRLRIEDKGPSWDRFVDIYGPLIIGWLKRKGVPEDVAEDVRQEVLMKVMSEIRGFDHNGHTGAFRAWLRVVMMHRLRTIQRRRFRLGEANSPDWSLLAEQLEDKDSECSRQWDLEHDRHLLERLIEMVSSEFQPNTMQAFRRVVLQCEKVEQVAADLGMSVNAIRISQSRVLASLRRVGEGFID